MSDRRFVNRKQARKGWLTKEVPVPNGLYWGMALGVGGNGLGVFGQTAEAFGSLLIFVGVGFVVALIVQRWRGR